MSAGFKNKLHKNICFKCEKFIHCDSFIIYVIFVEIKIKK